MWRERERGRVWVRPGKEGEAMELREAGGGMKG